MPTNTILIRCDTMFQFVFNYPTKALCSYIFGALHVNKYLVKFSNIYCHLNIRNHMSDFYNLYKP